MLSSPTSSGSAFSFDCHSSFINGFAGLKEGLLALQKWAVGLLAQHRTADSSVLASLSSPHVATLSTHLLPVSGHWKEDFFFFFSPFLTFLVGSNWGDLGGELAFLPCLNVGKGRLACVQKIWSAYLAE